MVVVVLVGVVAAAALVYASAKAGGGTVESIWHYVRGLRIGVTGLFYFLTALVFLATGMTGLIVAGFVILVYIFYALYYDIDIRGVADRVKP